MASLDRAVNAPVMWMAPAGEGSLLAATKRIDGRLGASQIAAASAASFLLQRPWALVQGRRSGATTKVVPGSQPTGSDARRSSGPGGGAVPKLNMAPGSVSARQRLNRFR
jgi:hypothetical protein